MQVIRVSWVVRIACYFLVAVLTFAFLILATLELFSRWRLNAREKSSWVVRSRESYSSSMTSQPLNPSNSNSKRAADLYARFQPHKPTSQLTSPYIVPKGQDITATAYPKKLPSGLDVVYKKVGFYDPLQEIQFLLRTNFKECEYSKCKMTRGKESADAMIFLIAKLKEDVDAPKFKRPPHQYWILKSDEAPSRFSWFESLKRPGFRESMNWTLTHKLNSDITVVYAKITEKFKEELLPERDYSKIYDGKSKMAAWFVSHCPVRSRRRQYLDLMKTRMDVDIFGKCGTKRCGMAEKIPGVVGMREQADNETCFPMLSADYYFYLAFENSLCQDYISEKFFKLFKEVDVVPVVRGGADYKRYFPSDAFVDASDFPTPASLADFLTDLAADKRRYIGYLKMKNRYRFVPDHPKWQCKLCEKLHTDRSKKTYRDVHAWWTENSCHDAMDSMSFY